MLLTDHKYNLSVRGGSETSNYFLSGSWGDERGIIDQSGYQGEDEGQQSWSVRGNFGFTPREDLTRALRCLAGTGAVELQTHSQATSRAQLPDLHHGLDEYSELSRRYGDWWPAPAPQPVETAAEPAEQLRRADPLTSPDATRRYLQARLRDLPYEVFTCLFLIAYIVLAAFMTTGRLDIQNEPVAEMIGPGGW